MTDTPGRRRIIPLLAGAGVIAVVLLGILLTRPSQDRPLAVAPLPPASPGVISAGYLGSHWRLTAVTDGRGTTEIPASVDAWLELAADGELGASDDVNRVTAQFTVTSTGFDVSDAVTTLAAYGGKDPGQLAAIAGIDAVTVGPPVMSSNAPEMRSVHVTVLSATREILSVQAGGVRLEFARTGPAGIG